MKVTLEVVLFEKLTRFVLARIIDRELTAQAAIGDESPHWLDGNEETSDGENVYFTVAAAGTLDYLFDLGCQPVDQARATHIALNDPAHVLARCAAERALVRTVITFETDPKWDAFGAEGDYAWLILTHLALADAGHPDFQEEWKS